MKNKLLFLSYLILGLFSTNYAQNLVVSNITTPSAANGFYMAGADINGKTGYTHTSGLYYIYWDNVEYWDLDDDQDAGDGALFYESNSPNAPGGSGAAWFAEHGTGNITVVETNENDISVTGAETTLNGGIDGASGTYEYGQLFNSRNVYDISGGGFRIIYDNNRWELRTSAASTPVYFYIETTSGSVTPPLTGWKKANTDASGLAIGILPVELVSFSYDLDEEGIQLNWETATEINNYGFDIERQVVDENNQNSNWEVVTFVPGNGNSNSPKLYEYTDVTAPATQLEYRLKQIDTDGGYEYFETTLSVDASLVTDLVDDLSPAKFELLQNYPNPFNPTTKISYNLSKTDFTKLSVYNMVGQEVANLVNKNQQAGSYSVSFDGANLSSGTYLYRLTSGENVQVKKMLMIK